MTVRPTFALSDGRLVQLKSFSLKGTYDGHLEGSRETLSPRILERLQRTRHDELGCQVILPLDSDAELPDWECEAYFESDAFRKAEGNDVSGLRVIFWTEQLEATTSLAGLLQPILPRVDWQSYAREWSFDDF